MTDLMEYLEGPDGTYDHALARARSLAERVGATVKESPGTFPFLVEREWTDALGTRRSVGFYAQSLDGVYRPAIIALGNLAIALTIHYLLHDPTQPSSGVPSCTRGDDGPSGG